MQICYFNLFPATMKFHNSTYSSLHVSQRKNKNKKTTKIHTIVYSLERNCTLFFSWYLNFKDNKVCLKAKGLVLCEYSDLQGMPAYGHTGKEQVL